MKLDPVTSSNIAAVGYDHATRTLGVQFKSGHLFHYQGVEPHQHAALLGADSVGKHFHAHIKSKFEGKKQ